MWQPMPPRTCARATIVIGTSVVALLTISNELFPPVRFPSLSSNEPAILYYRRCTQSGRSDSFQSTCKETCCLISHAD